MATNAIDPPFVKNGHAAGERAREFRIFLL